MDLRDGRNNVPTGPSDTVFIDKNTPTTDGVVFDPNTPALTDTLYVSTTNGSTWIYNGSAYTTYTAPAVNATPFYVAGTTIDAGSNKKSIIERSGEVRVKNSTAAKIKTISGTRSLLLSSYVNSKNEILSTGDQLWLGTSDNHPFYLRTNGVERLRALGTGAIRFNQAYSFPTTDGTVGQVLKTDGAGVVSFGDAAGGASGIWGISNSSGVYTYYATYQLALAQAISISAKTIELFADITISSGTSLILTNGININGNGHTINCTLSTINVFTDNNVLCACSVNDLHVIHTGDTNYGLDIQKSTSDITWTGSLTNSYAGCVLTSPYGTLSGAILRSGGYCAFGNVNTGVLKNCILIHSGTSPACRNLLNVIGCVMDSSSTNAGFYNIANSINCTIKYTGTNCAIRGDNGSNIEGCNISATSSVGVNLIDSSSISNSFIKSSSNVAVNNQSLNKKAVNNCTLIGGTTGAYASVGGSGSCYQSTIVGEASPAVDSNCVSGNIQQCSIISKWNNAGGHALSTLTGTTYILNCTLNVTNSLAYGIFSASTPTIRYSGLTLLGSVNLASAGIVQGITNTADAQGNLIIN
jgi:hypothetical protein